MSKSKPVSQIIDLCKNYVFLINLQAAQGKSTYIIITIFPQQATLTRAQAKGLNLWALLELDVYLHGKLALARGTSQVALVPGFAR